MSAASFRRLLAVHARVSEGVATVTVSGELDIGTESVLRRVLGEILRQEPETLIFDLAGVTFIDCATARVLLAASRTLPGARKAVIRRPSLVVRRLLQLAGLSAGFRIETPSAGSLRPGRARCAALPSSARGCAARTSRPPHRREPTWRLSGRPDLVQGAVEFPVVRYQLIPLPPLPAAP